jgi:RNA 2',3'-cyclic 3'-phosphodiesterase
MPRLFAGLELPAHISQILAFLRNGLSGARWIEASDYHVTLRFIGDISDRQANDIDSLLCDVARSPMTITLTGLDIFGGDKPHSLYASVEVTQPLITLQAELERIVRSCGMPPDKRRFQPHVTLARLRKTSPLDVADYLERRGYFPTQRFVAKRFVLYSARASVGGGPYKVETTYPLQQDRRMTLRG